MQDILFKITMLTPASGITGNATDLYLLILNTCLPRDLIADTNFQIAPNYIFPTIDYAVL